MRRKHYICGFKQTINMETAEERRRKVLEKLKEWNIEYIMHEHPPLPTIEEAMKYWKDFDSTHCKNLFFRNHKGNRHYLVILECHKQMDIHGLEHQLHQGKLSFASEQRMEKYLGTAPGSVSLFGLINDPDHQVKLYLDKDLQQAERVTFHPNDNTASLEISRNDMYRFIQLWGGEWEEL